MIEDLREGGLNVITVLEDIVSGIGDAGTPKSSEMTSKCMLIEYWRAFVCVISARPWN
jgi:hypothetical protein